MIKPGELIDKIILWSDLRFSINEDCGRGGFRFYLRINRDAGNGFVCKIGDRRCYLNVDGKFIVSGTLKVTKEFLCNIVISVDPTDENSQDGYAYHCFYSEKSTDYKYTNDAEQLVNSLLHIMRKKWLDKDYVYGDVIPSMSRGRAYDGIAHLSTYQNLGMYDSRLMY